MAANAQDPNPDHAPTPRRRWMRPRVLILGGAFGSVLLAVALVLFEPWTLFVNERVDDVAPISAAAPSSAALPSATAPSATAPSGSGSDPAAPGATPEAATPAPPPAGPVTLLTGEFITHEHETSGSVKVIELEDGSRILRIEGLDTSNGPDLRVWLADAPVLKGRAGWFVFDDGEYVELGELKGNLGNQNYTIPANVDLETLRSVSIWCKRFSVSFGAAALT